MSQTGLKRKNSGGAVTKPKCRKTTQSAVHEISDSDGSVDSTKDLFEDDKCPREKADRNSGKAMASVDKPEKQLLCPYGKKCYRTNTTHLEMYEHNYPEHPVRLSGVERYEMNQSTSFFLTKVAGLVDKFNNVASINIQNILSPSFGKLLQSAQFNYKIDIHWLIKQYPPEFVPLPLLVVHGSDKEEKLRLQEEAAEYSNVTLAQARLAMAFGTHHTKMMLLRYEAGLRVVIHTANLVQRDWFQKTQGVWMSPMFPKLPEGASVTEGESPTGFKRDLLDYIGAYGLKQLASWMEVIRKHDLSEAAVCLVGSVPGQHTGARRSGFGHLKLRRVLQQHGPRAASQEGAGSAGAGLRGGTVVGQFSSIGSLGPDRNTWLCGEFLQSLTSLRGEPGSSLTSNKTSLKLIFPSKDNVRNSLEGYVAGGSIPYSINNARKQGSYLHPFFHQWLSQLRGRSHAAPHIKTYLRASADWSKLGWFLLTSANLSKAAWGSLTKDGAQLMIRSYELGVLFLPKFFGVDDQLFTIPRSCTDITSPPAQGLVFPLPYDLPPRPYDVTDRPWIWDIPYKDLPDSHGNMWTPS